jgi:biopolymer transport protein ExbD
MSDIQTQEHRNKRSGARSKKLSTRIDLTPMVDLGFLLITFFIFTTTLSQPTAMKLVIPDDRPVKDPSLAPESKTISLILEDNDRIFYYQGLDQAKGNSTNYSATGLRNVIRQKLEQVRSRFGQNAEAIVLIKPTAGASYKNIVAVLDEMLINDVKKYVLMDPSTEETALSAGKS